MKALVASATSILLVGCSSVETKSIGDSCLELEREQSLCLSPAKSLGVETK
jgi:hypothetical protein